MDISWSKKSKAGKGVKSVIFVQKALLVCTYLCLHILCNSHLCPESLPQSAGVREAELSLEPDEQPAEAEI